MKTTTLLRLIGVVLALARVLFGDRIVWAAGISLKSITDGYSYYKLTTLVPAQTWLIVHYSRAHGHGWRLFRKILPVFLLMVAAWAPVQPCFEKRDAVSLVLSMSCKILACVLFFRIYNSNRPNVETSKA